jgi:hypothetical protein
MTDQERQELGARVAKALGWKGVYDPDSNTFVGLYDTEQAYRGRPDEPGECFKLCAEFNVWPYAAGDDDLFVVYRNGIEHYNSGRDDILAAVQAEEDTPTGRLNAAIEAVLLAVLTIKEQS